MMDKEIIYKIREARANIETNEEKINANKAIYDVLIKAQTTAIRRLIEELTPMLDYMSTKGISFENEELQLSSPIGPIIGYDKQNSNIYVILAGGFVNEINLPTKKITKENIQLEEFLKNYSFDFVYRSLLEQLDFQEKQLSRIDEKIKEAQTALNKYNLSY